MSDETVANHGITHLSAGGEIDMATADELTAAGAHALNTHGTKTLVIDMAAVTFMSAAGIGALVSINNKARQQGQNVIVFNASRCVVGLLELTALTDVFRLASADQKQTTDVASTLTDEPAP